MIERCKCQLYRSLVTRFKHSLYCRPMFHFHPPLKFQLYNTICWPTISNWKKRLLLRQVQHICKQRFYISKTLKAVNICSPHHCRSQTHSCGYRFGAIICNKNVFQDILKSQPTYACTTITSIMNVGKFGSICTYIALERRYTQWTKRICHSKLIKQIFIPEVQPTRNTWSGRKHWIQKCM